MLGISAFFALSDAIAQSAGAQTAGGAPYPALNAPATPETILRQVLKVAHD